MQKGFLLLETAVVSFLLVTVALVAVSYGMLNRQREAAETQAAAVFIAQEQIARIEADAEHYRFYEGEAAWLGDGRGPSIDTLNGRKYTVRTEIHAASAEGNIREVIVHVNWEIGGRNREQLCRKLVDCGA